MPVFCESAANQKTHEIGWAHACVHSPYHMSFIFVFDNDFSTDGKSGECEAETNLFQSTVEQVIAPMKT